MTLDRLYYELRLRWISLLLTPLLIVVATCLGVLLTLHFQKNTTLLFLLELEVFLPLAAGVAAANLIAHEPALELLLTMSRPHRVTGLLRLLLLLVWIACLAALSLCNALAFKLLDMPAFTQAWSPLALVLTSQLLWLVPLLWFIAVGCCLALLTLSRTAGGTLLAAFWLIDILASHMIAEDIPWLKPIILFAATMLIYPDVTGASATLVADSWLTTRFEVLATAFILLLLCWLLFRNTERLLKGTTVE
ncbi:MAG TPA: hypothetical protein VKR06_11900 [Ktedonosporobacter sp.]|nr:hypothetical protein [Ktedonosporobacter sp.]